MRFAVIGLAACIVAQALVSARSGLVINTWPFVEATDAAWRSLQSGSSAVDAVIAGCSTCERLQCDHSVGYGGSPDELGETTLDAMIIDGTTMEMGAVGSIRNVTDAIRTAALVMRHSAQTLLVGSQATDFAVEMGVKKSDLTTSTSAKMFAEWHSAHCQPNFRVKVIPDPLTSCGPYSLADSFTDSLLHSHDLKLTRDVGGDSKHRQVMKPVDDGVHRDAGVRVRPPHDTITMVVIDDDGHFAAGTSTNGLRGKVPGRVGDAAIPGAAAYTISGVGGCGATGDGDIMMRFLPCYQVIESMRLGKKPLQAVEDAMRRIMSHFSHFQGALVAVDASGDHAGASFGWVFIYSVRSNKTDAATVYSVQPLSLVDAFGGSTRE